VKTNIDLTNPHDDTNYKDKLNKSKEKDKNNNDKNYLLKTEKRNEKGNSIMNIVKENIEEENKEENKNNNEININNENIDNKKEEDPLITYLNTQGKVPDEEINISPKLVLEEIDGNLFDGKTIEINAGGMVGGRGKKDGFTIFGNKNIKTEIKLDSNINNNNNQIKDKETKDKSKNNNNLLFKPDFELNYPELISYPYIFAIYYKKEDKSYYIRAFSGKGSDNKILFIKLKNDIKYIIKQKELISAGDTIFQITPLYDNFLEIIHLERKKTNNINNKQIFEGKKNKMVILGRSKDSDFSFPKDKLFSRIQTTFEFDDTKKEWTVIDGKENKCSTNGTWIFGTHSFLIKKEMMVEILNSKIIIKEINNDKNNENGEII
jgi:hypothetical protein